jgi:hypothetical protein
MPPIGELIGIWVAALLTFAIFSFLYKDNPLFKLGESIFLGTALAYSLCLTYYSTVWEKAIAYLMPAHAGVEPKSGADLAWTVIVPMVLGLFILLRMIPKLSWLSRYSFAIYIAGAAGIAIPAAIAGQLLPQITTMMAPIGGGFGHALTIVLMLIGVTATVIFFFFSLEHTGLVGRISRIGVLFVMISFGASFGYTVMARVSLLIGRFQFLLYEWVHRAILGQSA